MPLGELLDDEVLGIISVLVLIYHDVGEARCYALQGLGIVPQEDVHIDQDIVKVHDSRLPEILLVALVHIHDARLLGIGVGLDGSPVGAVGADSDQIVLCRRNAGEHITRLVNSVVQTELLDCGLDGGGGIALVVYGKLLRISQAIGPLAKEAYEHRMEGAHHHPAGLVSTHQEGDSLFHFAGSFFGESKRQNAGRIGTPGQQIRHSAGENAGLAGTGSRHNQHRPLSTLDRLALLIIQRVQNSTHIVLHNDAKIQKKVVSSQGDFVIIFNHS